MFIKIDVDRSSPPDGSTFHEGISMTDTAQPLTALDIPIRARASNYPPAGSSPSSGRYAERRQESMQTLLADLTLKCG
jgi:hypothetical protein